jgi:hypothetical protein
VSSEKPRTSAPGQPVESGVGRVPHTIAGWLRGEEARDAALPAVAFVAAVHLLAIVATAVSAATGRATAAPTGFDLVAAWTHWDVGHYLGIAADGYSATELPERIVFFPLFPALIRLGSVVAPPLLVASAISAVATVAAVVGVYRLARMDGTRTLARWSVAFLLAYPASFSLVAPYTEGLFLAAAAWSLVLARGAPGAAGIAGFVAALTRLQGIFLVPALVVEALRARTGRATALVAALLPLAAFAAYLALNQAVFGDPLAFLRMQRSYWFHENAPPWVVIGGLVDAVLAGPRDADWPTVVVAPLLAFGMLAVTAAWTLLSRRSRPSYAAYAILTFAALATLTWPISVPRYVLGVVPVFLMLGGLGRWPRLATAAALVSGACMVVLAVVWFTGGWAF